MTNSILGLICQFVYDLVLMSDATFLLNASK